MKNKGDLGAKASEDKLKKSVANKMSTGGSGMMASLSSAVSSLKKQLERGSMDKDSDKDCY